MGPKQILSLWGRVDLRVIQCIPHSPDLQNRSLIIRYCLVSYTGHPFVLDGLIPLQGIQYINRKRKRDDSSWVQGWGYLVFLTGLVFWNPTVGNQKTWVFVSSINASIIHESMEVSGWLVFHHYRIPGEITL